MKRAVFVFIAALSASLVSTVALGAQHEIALPQRGSVPGAAPETAITPVVTRHTITVNGTRLSYTARAGFIPLLDEATGEVHAKIFFVSYSVDSKRGEPTRPLTFFTEGGPGAPTTLDDIGPRSLKGVKLPNQLPPPPYGLVDNQNTWLTFTDLVLIDPVGTGYSRATKPEYAAQYYSRDGDAESIAQFIQNYLQDYDPAKRQPVFVSGISYGSMRSALIAGIAKRHGLSLRGLMLLSSGLGNQPSQEVTTAVVGELPFTYSDLYYIHQLPTFTATALFHRKLAPELQHNFDGALGQAEAWATNQYPKILAQTDHLTSEQQQNAAADMARLTGLSSDAILKYRFRILPDTYLRELLGENWTPVGLDDSRRVKADEAKVGYDKNWYPVLSSLYLGGELHFKAETPYADYIDAYVSVVDEGWHCGGFGEHDCTGGSQALASLQRAMRQDHSLQVLMTNGYYDFVCPYFGTKTAVSGLEPDFKARITIANFHTGHNLLLAARPAVEGFIHRTLATNND